jgi:hypothetical protein
MTSRMTGPSSGNGASAGAGSGTGFASNIGGPASGRSGSGDMDLDQDASDRLSGDGHGVTFKFFRAGMNSSRMTDLDLISSSDDMGDAGGRGETGLEVPGLVMGLAMVLAGGEVAGSDRTTILSQKSSRTVLRRTLLGERMLLIWSSRFEPISNFGSLRCGRMRDLR